MPTGVKKSPGLLTAEHVAAARERLNGGGAWPVGIKVFLAMTSETDPTVPALIEEERLCREIILAGEGGGNGRDDLLVYATGLVDYSSRFHAKNAKGAARDAKVGG